jgi:hypothetical protein
MFVVVTNVCVMQVFLQVFLGFSLCFLGLDSYVVVDESHFLF